MRLTVEQEKRLRELNQKCAECVERAQKKFNTIEPKQGCFTCPIGLEVHQLDKDYIDGHNSARYERFFTA